MHTKRADWSRLHSLYNISLCLMPAQQHWLVKDAFKHSLQRCAVHAHCLVNYAQSLHKLVKKKQLAGVSALFWFMTRRGRGGGEWGQSSNWYTLTQWATIQGSAERSRSTSTAEPTWAGSVLYLWLCMCVTRQRWRWEFLPSDTNVSAAHPVDGEHAGADGISGPLLIKGKTSPKTENSPSCWWRGWWQSSSKHFLKLQGKTALQNNNWSRWGLVLKCKKNKKKTVNV